MTPVIDGILDLRGLPNPDPVLELAQVADALEPGESLEVLSDDPCARGDFLRWCGPAGIILAETQCLKDYDRFRLLRPAQAPRRRQKVAA